MPLGTEVTRVFAGVVGTKVGNDDVYEFVMWVASSNAELSDVADRLRGLCRGEVGLWVSLPTHLNVYAVSSRDRPESSRRTNLCLSQSRSEDR